MKFKLTGKIILSGLFALSLIFLTRCTSTSDSQSEFEWSKKNKELIKEHNLTVRELSGLPKNSIESNLEDGKVTTLDSLASAVLYHGVTAKIFWGIGTMVSTLQLEPNAK